MNHREIENKLTREMTAGMLEGLGNGRYGQVIDRIDQVFSDLGATLNGLEEEIKACSDEAAQGMMWDYFFASSALFFGVDPTEQDDEIHQICVQALQDAEEGDADSEEERVVGFKQSLEEIVRVLEGKEEAPEEEPSPISKTV